MDRISISKKFSILFCDSIKTRVYDIAVEHDEIKYLYGSQEIEI